MGNRTTGDFLFEQLWESYDHIIKDVGPGRDRGPAMGSSAQE